MIKCKKFRIEFYGGTLCRTLCVSDEVKLAILLHESFQNVIFQSKYNYIELHYLIKKL